MHRSSTASRDASGSLPPGLYVVATPLGNLEDLSPRAMRVLRGVPVAAAEDTRRARVLLKHAGARPRLLSYHAHSPPGRLAALLEILEGGDAVALVTDAGTPAISDPGGELVRSALERGIPVRAVPGPSAVAAALSVSGLPADRYTFLGFPPRKGTARRALLAKAATSPWTVVLFEAANRLGDLLDDLAAACGVDRPAVVARELTKVHEESRSGTLVELGVYYRQHPPRGEVTLVVAGSEGTGGEETPDRDAARRRARDLLGRGASRRDVAARLREEFGCSRNEAYRMVSEL